MDKNVNNKNYFWNEIAHMVTSKNENNEEITKKVMTEGHIVPFVDSNICFVSFSEYFEGVDQLSHQFIIEINTKSGDTHTLYDETGKNFLKDFDDWLSKC